MTTFTITLSAGLLTMQIDDALYTRVNAELNQRLDRMPGAPDKTLADIDLETLRRGLTRRIGNQHERSITSFATTAYDSLLTFSLGSLAEVLLVLPTAAPLRSFLWLLLLTWHSITITIAGTSIDSVAVQLQLTDNEREAFWWAIVNSYLESVSGLEAGY